MQERTMIQSDRPSYVEKPQYHLWVRNTLFFTTSKPHPLPDTWPSLHRNGGGGFPGGAVVENPPANAGDTGSSPGLGGSHMPRSK